MDGAGNLRLHAGRRTLTQRRPVAFQEIDGARREVEARFELSGDGGSVRFAVGPYDRTRALVIDPVLVYSTWFGGTSEESVMGLALDPAGNIYITGYTIDAAGFPTANAFQPIKPGMSDAFVAKFNPAGTALIYSTFLGGAQHDNFETFNFSGDVAVDAAGNAYVTGSTTSDNFPATPGADDTTFAFAGSGGLLPDAFFTKLGPTGALLYSTFIGGTGREEGTGITLDPSGNVYVVGGTNSSVAAGFPVTINAAQGVLSGGRDGFLVKFSAANQRVYATYLGGNSSEIFISCDVTADAAGNAYVVGDTSSQGGRASWVPRQVPDHRQRLPDDVQRRGVRGIPDEDRH